MFYDECRKCRNFMNVLFYFLRHISTYPLTLSETLQAGLHHIGEEYLYIQET